MPVHKVFNEFDSDSDGEKEVDQSLKKDSRNANKFALSESDDSSESDDNAEPEAVKFVDSKKSVFDRIRSAIKQIERDQQQQKAKRRKRDTIFKEQKRVKMELQKLPDDVLEAVSAKPPVQNKSTAIVNAAAESKSTASNTPPIQATQCSGDDSSTTEQPDYIPLNSGGIKVVDVKHAPRTMTSQNAIAFRHKQMFNAHIRRQPASEFLAKNVKQKIMRSS